MPDRISHTLTAASTQRTKDTLASVWRTTMPLLLCGHGQEMNLGKRQRVQTCHVRRCDGEAVNVDRWNYLQLESDALTLVCCSSHVLRAANNPTNAAGAGGKRPPDEAPTPLRSGGVWARWTLPTMSQCQRVRHHVLAWTSACLSMELAVTRTDLCICTSQQSVIAQPFPTPRLTPDDAKAAPLSLSPYNGRWRPLSMSRQCAN